MAKSNGKEARLLELSATWAHWKDMAEAAAQGLEKTRLEILAAGGKIGDENEHLKIGRGSTVEGDKTLHLLENQHVRDVIEREEALADVMVHGISLAKVRHLAGLNEAVATALKGATRSTPRFLRPKEKED